ncbi:MAG: cupin domain-containing protein [Solirubrobacteraceae bacterium]
MTEGTVVNWDDVAPERRDVGELGGGWRRLDHGSVGVARVEIDPGRRSSPVHSHGAEEELFYVLGGSGLLWQDGATHEIAAGDAICALAGGPAHTLIAGDDGLDVLAFGENADPPLVRLPHAGMLRRGPFWIDAAGTDPLDAEAAAGPLEMPAPSPRPPNVIAADRAPSEELHEGLFVGTEHNLGEGTGSVRSGLRRDVIPAGKWNCPPHWHAAEREIFVVLDGAGVLMLFANDASLAEEHPLRPGDVVRRPLGRPKLAHALRAADDRELTYLVYGTRCEQEIVFYPRSRKAWLGSVLVRLDVVDDYWDGEHF